MEDDIVFEIVSIADIRETDDYPGIRVALKANYSPISVPLAGGLSGKLQNGDIVSVLLADEMDKSHHYCHYYIEFCLNLCCFNI